MCADGRQRKVCARSEGLGAQRRERSATHSKARGLLPLTSVRPSGTPVRTTPQAQRARRARGAPCARPRARCGAARAVVAIARKCKSGGPDRPLLASIIHHTIRRKSARFLGSHTILNAAAAKA